MKNKSRSIFIFICVVPTLVLFLVFTVYPIIRAMTISFYKWTGLSDKIKFVGLDNFRTLLHDPVIINALINNLFLMLVVPVFTMFFAMFFATVLTRMKLREKNFYRVVFFFPNVLSIVVISVLWMFIYHPTFGILNSMLESLGLGSLVHSWLGEQQTVMWSVAVTMIWSSLGYYMVLYIAAMEGIPEHLYEAAVIDGAGEISQFVNITFPLVWEVVRITIIFFILNVFNGSFVYVNLMTNGGPNRSSEVLLKYMYDQAFKNFNYGYATTIGVLLFFIVLLLALISNKLTDRETIEI